MDLEGFIYEFNLVSTLTVKDVYDWACVLNNNTCKDYCQPDVFDVSICRVENVF